MLVVKELQKSFSSVKALLGVSFAAGDGLITGLLGPNGAGKSTTLRILSTVYRPDSGEATIDGLNVLYQAQQVRHSIGVLPHVSSLYQRFSARENIAYYGRLYGLQDDQIAQRVDELVLLLDMQNFIDRQTQGFSQGQRIKVALARALIHQPKTLMLDEPTNGLDVMATRALRSYLLRLRDEGLCIVFSSHIMQEVAALCDEIVIINKGSVVIGGSPVKIKQDSGCEDLEDAFIKFTDGAGGD